MLFRHLVIIALWLPAGQLLTGCGPEEKARTSELAEAGYPMNADGWFRAVAANDVAAMRKFLADGFDPLTRDAAGDSALHAAAAIGAQEAADLLLQQGVKIEESGASDRTPLMVAVAEGQTAMVKWLLRQGADATARDAMAYTPLTIAVMVEAPGPLAELAAYDRDNLDDALLLASLMGNAAAIDTLTQYGASVYARMDGGRTALMVAAEYGHLEAVAMLIELGTSRHAVDVDGRTAADYATEAGHEEIAVLIQREPLPGDLSFDPPDALAVEMEQALDATLADAAVDSSSASDTVGEPFSPTGSGDSAPWNRPVPGQGSRGAALPPDRVAIPLEGRTLGQGIATGDAPAASPTASAAAGGVPGTPPPLVMRQYRQRELPLVVRAVESDTATLRITGDPPRDVRVRQGETVPGSRLVVVSMRNRMQSLKDSDAAPVEVSVVELRDSSSGATRELISGVPTAAHDPVALVEDALTGRRYLATTGQRFRSADGTDYLVTDVRPNQMVIEDQTHGTVHTIPLRGPRG